MAFSNAELEVHVIRHVSLFSFAEGVTAERREAVTTALNGLAVAIPELRDYRFGPDAGMSAGNFDYAVVADFDDVDGYLAYRDHPEHRRVLVDVIAPIISARSAVQFVAG